jgi:hypothetical protein
VNRKLIHSFLDVLGAELSEPAEAILTGAGAGSLMGHVRPSLDVDFEIRFRRKASVRLKAELEEAVRKASRRSGLSAQYSEDIGGWSMISYLDYRKKAQPYQRFGKLNVKIMRPEHWTIGKMARFFESDIQDMIQIIRQKKLKPRTLVRLWAKAVRVSSLSLELGVFRDHVAYFLRKHGRKIWGLQTDTAELIDYFKRQISYV